MSRNDPHSYTNPDQGKIKHISLDLKVNFETCCLDGMAVLMLEGAHGGVLDLDTREISIRRIDGPNGEPFEYSVADPDGFMGAKLSVTVPPGTESLSVHYSTAPTASALQWLSPEQTAGKRYPYLYSQCQAIHARSIAPLQDSPQVRFTYQARLSVPKPLSAVMSAAPGEEVDSEDPGWTNYSFEMPQPIPSYLLALAVGYFKSKDLGPRTRVYAEPELLEESAWEFADAEQMVETAEGIFGKYLWDRFDFIVMPPSFPFGGMENPRLTFLTPSLIAKDRSLVKVLAHELAHSWTGNLVTNATMDDFWLNEGFTVWAERRIGELLEGRERTALHAALGRHALDEALERFGKDSPFTHLKNDLQGVDPDEVYSVVPYEKGFLFLTLIEQTIGRERFDGFVKDYVERFQFQSITTSMFEAFLDEKLPGIAEQVQARDWIHGPNLPENCPLIPSPRLEDLQKLAAGFETGERPDPAQANGWSATDWQVYLQGLPKRLTEEQCRWLDDTFGLTASENFEILFLWLLIAVRSTYRPAFDRLGVFLGRMGRMKFIKPLYTTLKANPQTAAMARELFDKNSLIYHPIARAGLQRIIES